METLLVILVLLIISCESNQKSIDASFSYTAATVEYRPVSYKDNPERTLKENAAEFDRLIETAATNDADIIVFPEFGLTSLNIPEKRNLYNWSTLVPNPENNPMLCGDSTSNISESLNTIACSAVQYSIYVVANVIEREKSSEENHDYFFYSTNVVCNPDGKLVARYRGIRQTKDLPKLDLSKDKTISTFVTNFNVTFANVIGLDIIYEEPLKMMLADRGIKNVVHTAAWRNIMPFETALQIQWGWAYVKNVNLLAAGLNDYQKGYSGSSIHAGEKTAAYVIGSYPTRVLYRTVAKTPKSRHKARRDGRGYHVSDKYRRSLNSQELNLTYTNLDGFEWKVIAKDGRTIENLTDNEIICEFDVTVSNLSPSESYYFVAHDTRATADSESEETVMAKRICAIIQCANATSIKSCNGIKPSVTNFDSIKITASYVDNERTLMMPNTLLTSLDIIEVDTFEESVHGRRTRTISLLKPTRNLATFGIWGRNFAYDKPRAVPSEASSTYTCVYILVAIMCSYFAVAA